MRVLSLKTDILPENTEKKYCTGRSGLPGSPCQALTCARPQSLDRTASSPSVARPLRRRRPRRQPPLPPQNGRRPPSPGPGASFTIGLAWGRRSVRTQGSLVRNPNLLRWVFSALRFICSVRSLARGGQSDPNFAGGKLGSSTLTPPCYCAGTS